VTKKEESTLRIEAQLETVIKLLAAPLIEGKNMKDSIAVLSASGLERGQIAAICHTTPESLRARLSEAKRKGKTTGKGQAATTRRTGEQA